MRGRETQSERFSSPRLTLARKGTKATSPTFCYRPIISTDLATTWGCEMDFETSSTYHGWTVEREARVTLSIIRPYKVPGRPLQILGSDPQPRQHPFLQPYKIGNPVVCEQLYLG